MDFNDYQARAVRTAGPVDDFRLKLARGVFGIFGEGGELADRLKKVIFHGHAMELSVLRDEMGDVLWYIAVLLNDCGLSLQDVAEHNVNTKLAQRYDGAGFDKAKSTHRKAYKLTTLIDMNVETGAVDYITEMGIVRGRIIDVDDPSEYDGRFGAIAGDIKDVPESS